MNRDEQSLIQNLFGKLADAERQAPPRDVEAEQFIAQNVSRQPGAPYYMAQTIIVQEQALEAAHARIQALEAQASQVKGSGGLLSSLFGGGQREQPARPLGYGRTPHAFGPWKGQQGDGQPGFGRGRMSSGGGFMAGAAQTAMGVAGGVVLGSMLSSAFLGGDPEAADAGEAADAEPASAENIAGEEFGTDFEEI